MSSVRQKGTVVRVAGNPHMQFVIATVVVALTIAIAASAKGQMPGTPVLQNAWAAPGIVVAADFGSATGGSTFAGAAAWSPGSGRFQLSGGAGIQTGSGTGSRGVYGARVAAPLKQLMGGSLGIAAFTGFGGGAGSSSDTVRATSIVPSGVSIGYRKAVGVGGRGFSVYADPNYQYHRGPKSSKGFIRLGLGLDAGITSRIGVTVGVESGATAAVGKTGPRGSSFGVGVSMKFGR